MAQAQLDTDMQLEHASQSFLREALNPGENILYRRRLWVLFMRSLWERYVTPREVAARLAPLQRHMDPLVSAWADDSFHMLWLYDDILPTPEAQSPASPAQSDTDHVAPVAGNSNHLQKNDPNVRWNSIRQGCKLQTVLAQELYQAAEVPQGPCGLPEIQKFQEHLTDYQIIVVSAKELNEVVFKGPHHEQKLILYLIDEHYHVITSMPSFMERTYFCWSCNKGYNDRKCHKCEEVCRLCQVQ
ncbi:uncharacterized protein LOC118425540 [Branchiostoma floridae]|uniref:Uncharacterized protein LOC118425540 n=1 Tax=Branchiostoma floridae TaxID=7739 RepID=A0A9J7LXV6_BRAFL|nr:uncharacterized protein LOC118425540 [Branchiostoma floridae]